MKVGPGVVYNVISVNSLLAYIAGYSLLAFTQSRIYKYELCFRIQNYHSTLNLS